jgi:peroxiredoxin
MSGAFFQPILLAGSHPAKEMLMRHHCHVLLGILIHLLSMFLIIGCTSPTGPVSAPPAAPSSLEASGLMLPALFDQDQRAYLGIDTTGEFPLTDIRAEVVLVEVFSMYCPHCQHEAPNVNRLYQRIAADPSLDGRIKIIGIGAGNTRYEVNAFQKRFNIRFPLFPDRNRQLAHQLAVRVTPTFVAFTYASDGTLHRILKVPGPLGNVEEFLARLLERVNVEKEIS